MADEPQIETGEAMIAVEHDTAGGDESSAGGHGSASAVVAMASPVRRQGRCATSAWSRRSVVQRDTCNYSGSRRARSCSRSS